MNQYSLSTGLQFYPAQTCIQMRMGLIIFMQGQHGQERS